MTLTLLNRMREFIRPIVPDPNVQPNHGWRHLFTTICEEAEISPRTYKTIMGHAGTTVADGYGDVTLKAKAAAIRKLPSFDLNKLRTIAEAR
jgi:integrase